MLGLLGGTSGNLAVQAPTRRPSAGLASACTLTIESSSPSFPPPPPCGLIAEEVLAEAGGLRDEAPTSFVDRAFDNEINIAVAATRANYDRLMFREALKTGWCGGKGGAGGAGLGGRGQALQGSASRAESQPTPSLAGVCVLDGGKCQPHPSQEHCWAAG